VRSRSLRSEETTTCDAASSDSAATPQAEFLRSSGLLIFERRHSLDVGAGDRNVADHPENERA
jgi:hypothetical protein